MSQIILLIITKKQPDRRLFFCTSELLLLLFRSAMFRLLPRVCRSRQTRAFLY